MKFSHVDLVCAARVDAPLWKSSADIESELSELYARLNLPEGRLELQTGIKRRGFWPVGTPSSEIATAAAKKLIAENKIDKNKIDLLIHASVCKDQLEPATSTSVHYQLGLSPRAINFDLSNACLGVLSGILNASAMIEAGLIENALIVSGENSAPLLLSTLDKLKNDKELTRKSIKPLFASLTIGSAGVAVFLARRGIYSEGHEISGAQSLSDTSAHLLCVGSGNLHTLEMATDSEKLLEHGVKLGAENWREFKQNFPEYAIPDHLFSHQVGVMHQLAMLNALELQAEKDIITYDLFGNTGSAAVVLALTCALDQKKLKKGDRCVFLGIGSGLNSTMLGVTW